MHFALVLGESLAAAAISENSQPFLTTGDGPFPSWSSHRCPSCAGGMVTLSLGDAVHLRGSDGTAIEEVR